MSPPKGHGSAGDGWDWGQRKYEREARARLATRQGEAQHGPLLRHERQGFDVLAWEREHEEAERATLHTVPRRGALWGTT